jgi:F0F1-type ATP synthase assembly protein I
VAGALIGWGIDRWLDSTPKGLLFGGIAGIAVGLTTLIRGAMKANREFDDARRGGQG